jgi:hypothetical protein
MPLESGSSRKSFSHNVEIEMKHGKPQKQAVAIAYRQAREKAKGGAVMCAHGGPAMCSMGCYAEGGRAEHEKGVHKATGDMPGVSDAGADYRMGDTLGDAEMISQAKAGHRKVIGEMRGMKKPNLYAKGGDVSKLRGEMTMGGHSGTPMSADPAMEEDSLMGTSEREMGRMPGMPQRNLMAEGGELVDADGDHDGDMDDGMMDQVVHEAMEAMHNRDAAGFKDALMCLVADCMMKMKAED